MNPAIRRESRFAPHRRLHRRLRPLALAAASLFTLASAGAAGPALPTGLAIVHGQASTAQLGNRLTVTNSAGALLNWQQFNIGAGAAVHFAQPSAASKVLNRVVGNDPSSILGSLSSNGQVWLQNPNGVLFGAGARIDVASLVATTLAISNSAWQDGLRTGSFQLGDANTAAFGGITNQGELRSASGGQVLLVGGAGGVHNEGLIHAPDGQVLLAAGAQVDLVDTSAPRVGVRLQAPQGEVLNLGRVLAGNGHIDLQAAMVNQQGIVRADGIGPGGAVVASASEALTLGAGSVTSASGATGGQVALDAGSGALLASGRIDATASAGLGGQVSLLGRQVGLLDGGAIDASGHAGGGAVRLGGGVQGRDAAYRNADATFMGRGASISADATGSGDGGVVVLWGNDAMRAYGTLSARGGARGGDGGFIETSGGWIDARPLAVSTRSPAGRAGQWLLDPYDILITDGVSLDFNISPMPVFISTGPQSTLSTATIAAALNLGTDVTVTTAGLTGGLGDILLSSANLVVTPPNAVSLTLNAVGNLNLQSSTIESTTAPLTVRLNAGASGGNVSPSGGGSNFITSNGGGISLSGSNITTRGGDIVLGGPSLACSTELICLNAGAVVGSASRLTKAIETSFSTLDAGTGAVRLDGHSIVDFAVTAGVRLADTTLSGRRIDVNGTVNAAGDNYRVGVELFNAVLSSSGSITVNGSATAPTPPTQSTLVGINMVNGSRMFIDGASAVLSMDGRVFAGSGEGDAGPLLIGMQLSDDSTKLTATGGAAIDLTGQARGEGFRVGISTNSRQPVIDAAAGSRLTLNSDNRLVLNADMVAPSGGSLVLRGDEGLFIDDMRLTGAPAAATLSGTLVAIGTQGLDTAVSFEGVTTLTVQAEQFLLGSSDGPSEGVSIGPVGESGQKQALAFVPPSGLAAELSSGGAVRIQANAVQIAPGAAVYSSAEGTAIDIAGRSAGSAVQLFVNDGGAGALQTPSGRWLVHAADSTGDGSSFLPGDLAAGFWQYADTPGTTAPAQGGNGFLFASTPTLSLPGSGSFGKVYDGTSLADLDGADLSIAGLRSGQRLVGAPSFAVPNAGVDKPLVPASGTGGYTVLTGVDVPVYGYGVDAATMRGTISQRPVSLVSATAGNKVYDGNTNATISQWSLSTVVEGDEVLASVNGQFDSPGAGSGKAVIAQVSALSGADATNYTVSGAPLLTTASITPRPLVAGTLSIADKVYDGTLAATITAWALGNVIGQDDVQIGGGTAQFLTTGVGTARPVTVTASGLTGADAANYTVTGLQATSTASITPRPLALQSVTVADKVYDGGTAATVSNWRLSGLLEGDQVQVQAGSAAFSSPGVGSVKPVTATVTTLGGTAASNYSASGLTAQATASITPATLTYLADAVSLRQGDTLPVLAGIVTGFVGEESQSRDTTGTLRFTTDTSTTAEPGRYAITGSGLVAANYGFVQAPGNATALTLTPAVQPPVVVVVQPEPTVTSNVATTTATAVVAVLAPTVASTPASGRALDAVPVLAQTGSEGGSRRFDSLDLDRMSAGTVAMALAARDAYKNEVFKSATDELATNPTAADAPGCASAQQAASGQCLLVRPVGSGLDISNARVVERAPITVPGVAPAAPAPAQVATAPAPARPVAAAPAAQAVPTAPVAPAAPVVRIQPMPPDLAANLPQRKLVARAAVPQIQRKIAVLIGIDRYQDERIPQLGNAVADARAVARTLTDRLGYETVVLENPGKATIFRTLNQLVGQVGPNDSVVLYYAGHGERVEKTGLGYWQPADADASRAETWVSNADIDRLLRQLPASQLAMVSDSCFSGSLVSGERIRGVPATPDPAALLNKRAVVVMTSGGNEPVFDSGLNGHSPFAWNLMQSLNQVGNQAGSWKPGSSIFEQVRFAVARKLPQRPQYGASSGGGHETGADYLFEQRQLR